MPRLRRILPPLALLATLAPPTPAWADFHDFLEGPVREICASGRNRATAPLAAHFKAEGVTDPVAYLRQEMRRRPRVWRLEDGRLPHFVAADLARERADALYVFSRRYFNRVVSSCELRVILYRDHGRLRKMVAYVFRHQL